MESTTDKKEHPSGQGSAKSYETRCNELADKVQESLDKLEVGPSDDLSKLKERIQVHLNLADFKFRFRQADHVKHLLYGPYVLSIATFLLAGAVFWVSQSQTQSKEAETKAALIVKVLDAPPGEGQKLLRFFRETGLLKLEPAEQTDLERLIK